MSNPKPTRAAAIEDVQTLLEILMASKCSFTLRHVKDFQRVNLYTKEDTDIARVLIGGRLDVNMDSHAQILGSLEIVYYDGE